MNVRMIWAGLGLVLFTFLDLATKSLAQTRLRGQPAIPVIPGFWDFQYAENRDVGFSLLRAVPHDIRQPLIFFLVGMGVLVVLGYAFRMKQHRAPFIGAVMVASGALGNLINRAQDGYVTDFILWYFKDFHWPVFNLADVYVVSGMFLILWHEWRAPADSPASPSP